MERSVGHSPGKSLIFLTPLFPSDSSFALSVTPLFSPKEVGTPTDFIFLIPQLRRELSERIGKGKGEREGEITRSFERRRNSWGARNLPLFVPV